MRLFGLGEKGDKPGEVIEDTVKEDGVVIADIRINRKTRTETQVKAVVADCTNGDTIFKVEYKAHDRTDFSLFSEAGDIIRQFVERNNYALDGEITTNGDIPTVRTISKRTR